MKKYERVIEQGENWLEGQVLDILTHYNLFDYLIDANVDSDYNPHAKEVYVWLELQVEDEDYRRIEEALANDKNYSDFFLELAKQASWDYPNAEMSCQDDNTIRFEINRLY